MDNTLLGIPLVVWGVLCLGIGVAYYYIWPQPNPKRAEPRTRWQHIVLRYFHMLVWVLLAGGCFLAGLGLNVLGGLVAFLALPAYIYFLVVLLQDRSKQGIVAAPTSSAPQESAPPPK